VLTIFFCLLGSVPIEAANEYGRTYPHDVGLLHFPSDEGAHSGLGPLGTIEFWSLHGIVRDRENRAYALEVTFFNLEVPWLDPEGGMIELDMPEMASMSVLDLAGGERYAYATGPTIEEAELRADMLGIAWGENELQTTGDFTYRCRVVHPEGAFRFELNLSARRPPFPAGWDGATELAADLLGYAYTLPDLVARGTLSIGGESRSVEGWLQLDHVWFPLTLSSLLRWLTNDLFHDWLTVRLDDGTGLLLYRAVPETGSAYLPGVNVLTPDGDWTYYSAEMVEPGQEPVVEPSATFHSVLTGNDYPVGWRIELPRSGITLELHPLLGDGELAGWYEDLDYSVWQGPLRAWGTRDGNPVQGIAWLRSSSRQETSLGPNPPYGLEARAESGKLRLSWSYLPDPNLAGFNIAWTAEPDGAPEHEVEIDLLDEYELIGLQRGKPYRLFVRARDAFGRLSAWSNEARAVPRGIDPAPQLELNQRVLRNGDRLTLLLRWLNDGPIREGDLYLALEAGDRLLFYPTWGPTPTPLRRWIFHGSDRSETLLDLRLPVTLDSGGPYRFHAVLTRPDSPELFGTPSAIDFRLLDLP
jgi:predicted secreted hydrolase